MLVRVYKPFVRINDEEEFQINISEDLRIFLENHPNKDGDLELFSIDIEKEDLEKMKKLAIYKKEKEFVNDIKVGDYILIEPHVYICESNENWC